MNEKYLQYLKPTVAIAIIIFMGWYFMDIVAYILVATFLSMIGSPAVKRLDKIRIGKRTIPHNLSAIITLLGILISASLFLILIVPLIVSQANVISSIDENSLSEYFAASTQGLYEFLVQYEIVGPNFSLSQYLDEQLVGLIDVAQFTRFFSNIVSGTGSVIMGIFIIVFLTYYFLVEDNLMKGFLLTLTPERYTENVEQVLHDSKFLLVRYFHGILIEVGIMMTIESVGLLIFGVPNAILIGFLGGMMNIIPYLGPLIGALIGVVLAALSVLGLGEYDSLMMTVVTVFAVFAGANLVDNFVLQPQIYSKSVKAHPVEIFLTIIIGGKLAGIAGMILAIPTYTVIKVIVRQVIQRMKLAKYLNKKT